MSYFWRGILLLLEMLAVMMAYIALSAASSGRTVEDQLRSLMGSASWIDFAALWLVEIAYQILALRLVVMRLHDIGVRGGWGVIGMLLLAVLRGIAPNGSAAVLALDAIGLVVGLCLLFWPGTKGPNAFGADPRIAPRGHT